MIKKLVFTAFLIIAISGISVFGQQKTVINDAKAKTMLLGKHKTSLQWIGWNYFGAASVTNKGGVYYLKGNQKGRGETAEDYLTIDGVITLIDAKTFEFAGKIMTRVSHINNGEPCERDGEFVFKITGTRKYWRLQEMDNPCEAVTDYVDIYFR